MATEKITTEASTKPAQSQHKANTQHYFTKMKNKKSNQVFPGFIVLYNSSTKSKHKCLFCHSFTMLLYRFWNNSQNHRLQNMPNYHRQKASDRPQQYYPRN
ncbi:hypothetical protein GO294_04903 [Ralstonia solanacearum]|nr:hypothetical protein [Ralstonia solanacearum]